jgi:hypothetical protein
MRHLFNSRVEVLRLSALITNGVPVTTWDKVQAVVDPFLGAPGELLCRLDLVFLRLGKDQPMPLVAGRAPDRTGVLFFTHTNDIRSGDRIRALAGPVTGTFEIRTIPDIAVGFSAGHHCEVQVVEVAQSLPGVFPGVTLSPTAEPVYQ